ncbi:MAG: glycoside hydrolase family 3 protein [Candidatus Hinthialibacter antarcticus]|nr:glycoside hydrolase family 3 protein [Candidatus Hinthialibacter antarcticus]
MKNQSSQPLQLSDSKTAWVEQTLASMSDRQKIGQLFCPYLMHETLTAQQQIEEYAVRVRNEIGEYAPAGYYLNRYYLGATPLLIDLMQLHSEIPMFIGADMESGAGGGFGGVIAPCLSVFPPAMAIGATGFEPYAYLTAYHTAVEAKAIGVNWVFAPVMDVNINPVNPIINTRSYSGDPECVAAMAQQAIRGLHKGGVISCGKHFPGHGDTSLDTHLVLDVIEADRERLDSVELLPYRRAIEQGELPAIMTSHISVPALDPGEKRPATVSPPIITGLLRVEMGFDGLIVTDAMLMGGITTLYESGEAAILALEAGVDLILMPADFAAAYASVEQAVQSGRLSQERIDASIRRILSLKARFDLHEQPPCSMDAIDQLLQSNEADNACASICSDAVTIIANQDGQLPLPSDRPTAALAFFDTTDEFSDFGEAFFEEMEEHSQCVSSIAIMPTSNETVYETARECIEANDVIVVAVAIDVLPDKGTVQLPESMAELIDDILASGKTAAIIAYGSPYLYNRFPDAPVFLCGYGYLDQMCAATVDVLYGARKARGEAPVKLK